MITNIHELVSKRFLLSQKLSLLCKSIDYRA